MKSKALWGIVTWLKSVPSGKPPVPERQQKKREMGRSQFVVRHAPPAPPCFQSVLDWHEFLKSAAEGQKGQDGPLVIGPNGPVDFNRNFNFCSDCTEVHMQRKSWEGKCKPNWLREQIPPPPDVSVELDMSGESPSLTSSSKPAERLQEDELDFSPITNLIKAGLA